MSAVLESSQDILFVDRTGGGKTAIIFGPALIGNGVTVYLRPIKSLKHDLRQKCKIINLPVYDLDEIENCSDLPEKGIVPVSPEQVGSENCSSFVGLMYSLSRLRRLVVEEVHIIVLSDHYRECMNRMRFFRPETMKKFF